MDMILLILGMQGLMSTELIQPLSLFSCKVILCTISCFDCTVNMNECHTLSDEVLNDVV